VRLSELAKIAGDVVDLAVLQAAGVLPRSVTRAKIFLSGAVDRALTVRGLKVTKGAREAIEKAGGRVED
jgi:large subunit ribosomal protein L15